MPEHVPASATSCCTNATFASCLLWALIPFGQADAYNAITIDTGYGMEDARLLRLNLSIGDDRRYPADNGWYWSRSWEGNLSYWYLYKHIRGEEKLLEAGITPNFRLERERQWGRPYLEAGLGVHLLSKKHIGLRDLGSTFQFGTHAGFGARFGGNAQYDLSWRIEHLSNAGIREPNPGINFSMVRFGYRW